MGKKHLADYSEDDNVEGLDLTITDGRITSIGIQNVAFNGYPDLNINSTTGTGSKVIISNERHKIKKYCVQLQLRLGG